MFKLTPYEMYTFCLCMVVYVLLSGLFIFLLTYILRLLVKHIRNGLEDAKILAEYRKNIKKNKTYKKQKAGWFDILVTVIFCCIIFGTFAFSVYTSIYQEKTLQNNSIFRVVLSDSMGKKNEKNKYLLENNLNNQFQQFDLILTHALPDEDELKLYDIVVYEVDDILIVHRIVGIEERNEKHPEERHFLLQGDSNSTADRFPVLYSQMRAVYKGYRIPFIGSFVAFLQSPAGYMCILLILFSVIMIPMLDRKLVKERFKRLMLLLQSGDVDEHGKMIDRSSSAYAQNTCEEYYCNCPYCPYSYYSADCYNCPYNATQYAPQMPVVGKQKKNKKKAK